MSTDWEKIDDREMVEILRHCIKDEECVTCPADGCREQEERDNE